MSCLVRWACGGGLLLPLCVSCLCEYMGNQLFPSYVIANEWSAGLVGRTSTVAGAHEVDIERCQPCPYTTPRRPKSFQLPPTGEEVHPASYTRMEVLAMGLAVLCRSSCAPVYPRSSIAIVFVGFVVPYREWIDRSGGSYRIGRISVVLSC